MLHRSIGIGIGIGIAKGQYYWILGALFGIILTLLLTLPNGGKYTFNAPENIPAVGLHSRQKLVTLCRSLQILVNYCKVLLKHL